MASALKSFQTEMPESITASEIARLSAEHADLAKKQYEVLQKAPSSRMSKNDADEYDRRHSRIVEIHRLLAQFKA
jgi:hypothetical protein